MQRLIILVAACMFGIAAPTFADEFQSLAPLGTQPFNCSAPGAPLEPHYQWWQNTTGRDLRIGQVRIWMGMSYGGRADYHAQVLRYPDWMSLATAGWDRYSEPVSVPEYAITYSPHWVNLAQGDWLVLYYFCAPVTGPTMGHVSVTIWYTLEP